MNDNIQEALDEFEKLIDMLQKNFHSAGSVYLSGMDITIQQFMVMHHIYRLECPKMTEIADQLGRTLGNMTAMIDRLIKQSYVVRKADPEDRRLVRVCLTPKGKNLFKKAEEKRRKDMRAILGCLLYEDRKDMIRMMKRLAAAIKNKREGTEQ